MEIDCETRDEGSCAWKWQAPGPQKPAKGLMKAKRRVHEGESRGQEMVWRMHVVDLLATLRRRKAVIYLPCKELLNLGKACHVWTHLAKYTRQMWTKSPAAAIYPSETESTSIKYQINGILYSTGYIVLISSLRQGNCGDGCRLL